MVELVKTGEKQKSETIIMLALQGKQRLRIQNVVVFNIGFTQVVYLQVKQIGLKEIIKLSSKHVQQIDQTFYQEENRVNIHMVLLQDLILAERQFGYVMDRNMLPMQIIKPLLVELLLLLLLLQSQSLSHLSKLYKMAE